MEKKVIKFNLVGAILVLILIFALIIGTIIAIPKAKNNFSNNDKNNLALNQGNDDNKEYHEELYTEDGEKIECNFKKHKSKLGYSMKYDYEAFTVDDSIELLDCYRSLISNSIGISVEKEDGEFRKTPELLNGKKLKNDGEIDYREVREFRVTQENYNNNQAFKRVIQNDKKVDIVYCIRIDENSYYIVKAFYNLEYENQVSPRLQYMINSFEINK